MIACVAPWTGIVSVGVMACFFIALAWILR